MYNAIGLTSARGSGTNGYVQKNLSFVNKLKQRVEYKTEDDIKKLEATLNRPPNQGILLHQRKRQIEVKCLEMKELLEEQSYSEEEIEKKIAAYREVLIKKSEEAARKKEMLFQFDENGRPLMKETHQMAEVNQERNDKLKSALGISPYFVEGSSLDPDRKAKEALAKSEELEKYELLEDTPSPEPIPKTVASKVKIPEKNTNGEKEKGTKPVRESAEKNNSKDSRKEKEDKKPEESERESKRKKEIPKKYADDDRKRRRSSSKSRSRSSRSVTTTTSSSSGSSRSRSRSASRSPSASGSSRSRTRSRSRSSYSKKHKSNNRSSRSRKDSKRARRSPRRSRTRSDRDVKRSKRTSRSYSRSHSSASSFRSSSSSSSSSSRSSSSTSSSSGSSTTSKSHSRSPPIRRRRGSPNFLEKRRITRY